MQGNRQAKRGEARSPRLAAFFVSLMLKGSGLTGRRSLVQEEEVIVQGRLYFPLYCGRAMAQRQRT
jgi:hypothetical protein